MVNFFRKDMNVHVRMAFLKLKEHANNINSIVHSLLTVWP